MRTFPQFQAGDREHRLIYEETPTPEPVQLETADRPPPPPETEALPIETLEPEAVEATAAETVEATDASIATAEAPMAEVDAIIAESGDPAAVTEAPAVQAAQFDLNAAINGTADFVDSTGATRAGNFIRSFGDKSGTTEVATESETEDSVKLEDQPIEPTFTEEEPTEMLEADTEEPTEVLEDEAQEPTEELEADTAEPTEVSEAGTEEPVTENEEQEDPYGDTQTNHPDNDMIDSEEPTVETPLTLDDYEARDIENSRKDNPEASVPDTTTTETPAAKEPVDSLGGERNIPEYPESFDQPTKEEEIPTTDNQEKPAEGTEDDVTGTETKEASESIETPAESYEREKGEQKLGRETEKLADVRSGTSRNEWSTIPSGKTDWSGKPFLYKEGTGADGKGVLLAYSPNGGVQVMDTDSGDWKFLNQMKPEEQAQIKGTEGMDEGKRDAALNAEKLNPTINYSERVAQNERNHAMEEDCLKDIKADPEWFAKNMDNPLWKGNEKVRDALAASLESPTTQDSSQPDTGTVEAPAIAQNDVVTEDETEDDETTEDTSETTDEDSDTDTETVESTENPEIAALMKIIEALQKEVGELKDRISTLENPDKKDEGTADETPEETKDEDEKTPENTEDSDSDEDAKEEKELSEAERAEKNKKETDDALDELEGKTEEGTDDTEDDVEGSTKGESKVEEAKETKESTETEQELRSRLMAEVRNDGKKTVDDVKKTKEDTFKTVEENIGLEIRNSDGNIETQGKKVESAKAEVSTLKTELAGAKEEDRGAIEGKIQEAEAKLAVEQESLGTMEKNRDTFSQNLSTAKAQYEKEVGMLETLESDWEKTAKRSDAKFKEMGEKLISLEDSVGGKIVQGIGVEHDGSLGLKMTGSTNAFEMFLNGMSDIAKYGVIGASVKAAKSILDENEMKKLTVDDNPAPAMKAVNAYVKSLEAKKGAKA